MEKKKLSVVDSIKFTAMEVQEKHPVGVKILKWGTIGLGVASAFFLGGRMLNKNGDNNSVACIEGDTEDSTNTIPFEASDEMAE